MATEVTTSPTYLELISRDEKTVKQENLKIKAQEAALAVAKEILVLNQEITAAKGALDKAQRAVPYSVIAEYKVSKDLEILEARLAFVENIKSTRFTDATI